MKLKSKILVAASATVLTLGAGAATLASAGDRGGWSGQRGHHMGAGFKKMDRAKEFLQRYDVNDDGKLSQQEIDTVRKELFAKYDSDQNGTLTLAEFQPLWLDLQNLRMVRAYQRLDKDGNAEITEIEFVAPLSQIVQFRDRNGDGFLSPEDRRRRGGQKGGPGSTQ